MMEMEGEVEACIGAGDGVRLKCGISYWGGLGERVWIGAEDEDGEGIGVRWGGGGGSW